jgi:cysteine desulfurase family protein (TIGR01976 family)
MPLDIQQIRSQFPALSLKDDGKPRIYLDNPAGTQVPRQCIKRTTDYLIRCNANHGGRFRTSMESDEILAEAHRAMADFLNAPSADEIIFGPNMTTLTYAVSRSVGHWLRSGDQIILTRMDHDANVNPWLQLAADLNLQVKWLSFNRETYRYDSEELGTLLSPNIKLVAVNHASNAIGTINDIKKISEMAHNVGALVYVDAVQYVPHSPADVPELGCDFLVCSVYKFFGGHQGVLWGKPNLLEKLPAYKVRPADDFPPGKFETGTQSHEGQAGTLGALEYLAGIGETMAQEYYSRLPHLKGRRKYLHAAMAAIKGYEKTLSARLIEGLQQIPGVKIHGITDLPALDDRVPTVSFTREGFRPEDIARRLAEENIFVWDGHFYAVEVVEHLGLSEKGGMVRVGAVHYNTVEEIDKLLEVISGMKR